MNQIPASKDPLVIRTDFSDQGAWEKVCEAVREPESDFGFVAYVTFLDDLTYQGIIKEELLALISQNYDHSFIIVADQMTLFHPEQPLLIIDLYDEPGREFRAIPSQIQGIENNLSIANMDFDEFAGAVDEDGVFRGFS